MSESDNTLELEDLSAKIATLSEAGSVPKSFDGPVEVISADEINWSTNSWIEAVQRVLPWCYLSGLDLSNNTRACMRAIFEFCAAEDPFECFTESSGLFTITDQGIAYLDSLFELALQYKAEFEEMAAETSVNEANSKWAMNWEDFRFDTASAPAVVDAAIDGWVIQFFKGAAEENMLDLNPSYQRDVVWSPKDSTRLIESILRGIPLPSIILHDNTKGSARVSEIVDGKQRLTAILRFAGAHPTVLRELEILSEATHGKCTRALFETDYKKWWSGIRRELTEQHPVVKRIKPFLPFPFKLQKPPKNNSKDSLASLHNKYYYEIQLDSVKIAGRSETVRRLFTGASEYKIPVIIYKNTDLRHINAVFSLYNSQGKQLNKEELRNAEFHHLDLTRILIYISDIHETDERTRELTGYQTGDLERIHQLLQICGINPNRYQWSKLIGWVVAMLVAPGEVNSDGSFKAKSTSAFLDSMFTAIQNEKGHKKHLLRTAEALNKLCEVLLGGTDLFLSLHDNEFPGEFYSKKVKEGGNTDRWDGLPFVATWISCCLAYLSGISVESINDDPDEFYEKIFKVTDDSKNHPLDKQQTISQWAYFGQVILALLDSMSVNQNNLSKRQREVFDADTVAILRAARSLKD